MSAYHHGEILEIFQDWMYDLPGAPSRSRVRAELAFQKEMFREIKGNISGVSHEIVIEYFTDEPTRCMMGQLFKDDARAAALERFFGFPEGAAYKQLPGGNCHPPLESTTQNFLLTSEAKRAGIYSWKDVLVIGQYQLNSRGCEYLPGFLHMCGYVREVFRSQPTRLWVHSYYLYGGDIQLWISDRTGLSMAKSYTISDGRLLKELALFYESLSESQLGLNPIIHTDDKGTFVLLDGSEIVGLPRKYYLEDKPITSPRTIVSRGPTCYRVRLALHERYEFVFKISRKSSTRFSEERMLRLASQRDVWGVTELICHQTVKALTHSLSCMVIYPLGRPLSKYKTVLEVLEALRDAIKGHQSLYINGRILHQDISPGNIIIWDTNIIDAPRGVLIDLDLAMDLRAGPARPGEIVGTKIFMAIGVLESAPHTYRHDLESFFYVFLWIAVCGSRRTAPAASMLRRWQAGTWGELSLWKRQDMSARRFEMLLSEFRPEFKEFSYIAVSMRQALFQPGPDGFIFKGTRTEAEAVKNLYETMICSLSAGVQAYEGNRARTTKLNPAPF